MAITFLSKTKDQISLEDFIKITSKKIIFGNEDSLLDCVEPLFKLANNQSFLTNYINQLLISEINEDDYHNPYSEQSYIIYDCDAFYLRITYWPVLSKNSMIRDSQNSLFSYGFVHDHNFPLLTVGCGGDGYITKLWEYEYEKVVGYKNEKVDIKFLEETTLSKGKALYYRPSKDIHCQFPPEKEDSMAINIILKSFTPFNNKQYEFDIDNNKIKNILFGSDSSKIGLIKFSTYFNNSKTLDLLNNLASSHEITQIKTQSLEALYLLSKNKVVWENGMNDENIAVSKYSKHRIKEN